MAEPGGGSTQKTNRLLPPGATVVAFDPVIPPLRVPIPAGQDDDPSKGAFLLAFKDQDTWLQSWRTCETKLMEQCQAGARMGCSINATKKCQPSWWHMIFPFISKGHNHTESEAACEEREMLNCLKDAEVKCTDYARDTCKAAYCQARIASPSAGLDSRFHEIESYRKRLSKKDISKSAQEKDKDVPRKSSESPTPLNFDMQIEGKANLLGNELSHGGWRGPTWVDGSLYCDSQEKDQLVGFEGGLIWPKTHSSQNLEANQTDEVGLQV